MSDSPHAYSAKWDQALAAHPPITCGRLDMLSYTGDGQPIRYLYCEAWPERFPILHEQCDFIAYAANRAQPLLAEVRSLIGYKVAFESELPFRDRAQRLLSSPDCIGHLGKTHLEGLCCEVERLRAELEQVRAAVNAGLGKLNAQLDRIDARFETPGPTVE